MHFINNSGTPRISRDFIILYCYIVTLMRRVCFYTTGIVCFGWELVCRVVLADDLFSCNLGLSSFDKQTHYCVIILALFSTVVFLYLNYLILEMCYFLTNNYEQF